MLEKQSLSDQLIINCLNSNYGIEVATITFLPLGSVYKAQAHDKRSYFVKLKRGHHYDITVIVELLHGAGIQQIIPPIRTIHGQPIHHINEYTLIVYPFIEGQDGFNRNLTDNQWFKLGKVLRQVHEIHVPPSIQNRIRQEAYSPKWREIVQSLSSHLKSEPTNDEIAIKLAKFMKERIHEIHQLVDRAEQLSRKLRDESPKFVLCHSDIHGGNVLMDANDTIYIVDWDDPIMAPKERDLMFIGGGVGNVWNKPHEENYFYKGYGNTEVNSTILAYYRYERIVEDIALYSRDLLLTTAGGLNRQEMYKQFIAMFEPQGVVDIAFKTDKA
jgi:spectinomycin phosphotransferase